MKQKQNQLLSTSTILILSGFLVGLTVGRIVGSDLSPYVLACGLSGFLSYIALDIAATKREENQAFEEIQQMEQRLDKHVNSISSMAFRLPDKDSAAEMDALTDDELCTAEQMIA